MSVDVLTVSAKGQISIPSKIRKELSIEAGDKMAVFVYNGTILMKPIRIPSESVFKKDLDDAQAWAESVGYKEDNVDDIIKSVRKKKRE